MASPAFEARMVAMARTATVLRPIGKRFTGAVKWST
jgi:hypothetical protein